MAPASEKQSENTPIAAAMLDWYDGHSRDLPWRVKGGGPVDPYRVWLSEIMLQQTTVATVKAYFEKFTRLWPTIRDLAAAPLDDVLREWAGLGYYARARNLHKCANAVVDRHGGTFPHTEAGLLTLPGVGAYTAAAIASIAFNEPASVVDGNIERVYARLTDDPTPLPKLKERVRAAVSVDVPVDRPGDFAQSLMDLGATICTPKRPNCLICPIRPHCTAHSTSTPETLPVKAPKKAKPIRKAVAFWLVVDDHVLLERRPEKGLLGSMVGLPVGKWEERSDFPGSNEWIEDAPIGGAWQKASEIARHTFTHFHLETEILTLVRSDRPDVSADQRDLFWLPLEKVKTAGLPTVFKKMVKLVLQ